MRAPRSVGPVQRKPGPRALRAFPRHRLPPLQRQSTPAAGGPARSRRQDATYTPFHCPPAGPACPCSANPFELPSEEDWARLQLEERAARRQQQREQHGLPVEQKATLSSRMHAAVDPASPTAGSLKALLRGEEAGPVHAAAEVALPDYVRRHRENMRDFIAKKRQIFLVQMSLDTKRTEISKLDQRSRQRAEALQARGRSGGGGRRQGWLVPLYGGRTCFAEPAPARARFSSHHLVHRQQLACIPAGLGGRAGGGRPAL